MQQCLAMGADIEWRWSGRRIGKNTRHDSRPQFLTYVIFRRLLNVTRLHGWKHLPWIPSYSWPWADGIGMHPLCESTALCREIVPLVRWPPRYASSYLRRRIHIWWEVPLIIIIYCDGMSTATGILPPRSMPVASFTSGLHAILTTRLIGDIGDIETANPRWS